MRSSMKSNGHCVWTFELFLQLLVSGGKVGEQRID